MSQLKHLATLEEYEQAIKSDKLCCIKFTATWCPPCQKVAPLYVALATEMADVVDCVECDVDANGDAAGAAGVEAMPTFMFYKNGEKLHSVRGADIDAVRAGVVAHK